MEVFSHEWTSCPSSLFEAGMIPEEGFGRTVQLSVDRAFELPELSCKKHDTGFSAHMAYSITHHHHRHALIIVANDTDIFMMFVYFITQLDDLHELYIKKMTNYSPVYAITDDLAVKYLYRRWKRRAYKATIDRLQDLQPLAKYGNDRGSLNVQDDGISSARLYVMTLSAGMTLTEIWMRYKPISLATLKKTCDHCQLYYLI